MFFISNRLLFDDKIKAFSLLVYILVFGPIFFSEASHGQHCAHDPKPPFRLLHTFCAQGGGGGAAPLKFFQGGGAFQLQDLFRSNFNPKNHHFLVYSYDVASLNDTN